jgi:hypothetical protein
MLVTISVAFGALLASAALAARFKAERPKHRRSIFGEGNEK